MTIAGPPMRLGIRYCTYIWLTVIVPGTDGPTPGVSGWLDVAVSPFTKKLPSSSSSKGPPSDPAIVLPPAASSIEKPASALRQFPLLQIIDPSHLDAQIFKRGTRSSWKHIARVRLDKRGALRHSRAWNASARAASRVRGKSKECVPGAAQREAKRNGALQTRDRYGTWRSRISGAPLHFVSRCTASGTRE